MTDVLEPTPDRVEAPPAPRPTTPAADPDDRAPHLMPELFAAQVRQRPEAVAVVHDGVSLTYAELDAASARLADRLRRAGTRPGDLVGVYLDRSATTVVALLGVLRAGAAYVPLDPKYPAERVSYVASDAGIRTVVTEADLRERAAALAENVVSAELDTDPAGVPTDLPTPHRLHPAYVIYTSGSTGRPKGVVVTHDNLAHFLVGMDSVLGGPDSTPGTWLAVTSISFDIHVVELLWTLTRGYTVVIGRLPTTAAAEGETAPEPVSAQILRHGATHLQCTPSLARIICAEPDARRAFAQLQHMLVGGEALPPDLAVELSDAVGGTVHNMYGPTEATVWATTAVVDGADVHIGRPLPGVRAYVIDENGQPLPDGATGELALAGPYVTRGYHNRPGLTAERFIPDPEVAGGRLYRTGDLARRREDGNLAYLGRIDDQVKIRGHRIELGEIEATLATHPKVHAAAAAVRQLDGNAELAAYVIPTDPADPPSAAELRAYLSERLPAVMVPATVTTLDRFPLTPNGKLDRRALPDPTPAPAEEAVEPPATPTEQAVAEAWCKVLGLEQVSRTDDFFAIGGHSFAATRVAGRLRHALGHDVPLRLLFENPVLADLAAAIDRETGAGGDQATPDSSGDDRIPVRDKSAPIPVSSVQQRLWFLAQLEPDSPAYHIPLLLSIEGDLDVEALAGAVTDVVTRHEILRTVIIDDIDGNLTAKVLDPDAVTMAVVDTTAEELRAMAQRESDRPFRMDTDPPFRITLFRLGDGTYALCPVFHHIAVDAWSVELLLEDLSACYAARVNGTPPPPAPELQYADYAAWSRGAESTAAVERAVDWWARHLAGAPPVLELPTDRPRPQVATTAEAAVRVNVPLTLAERIRKLAADHQATPFMVMLAAWQALLGRLANSEDVVIGVPHSGRHHPDTETMVGCFINTLAIRGDLSGDPTVVELLQRVRTTTLEAFAHAQAPFEQVVDRIKPPRHPSITPVFQVMLNVIEDSRDLPPFPGVKVDALVRPKIASKYDLNLGLVQTGDGYLGGISFRADLFDTETVQRWADWFVQLLHEMTEHPDRPVAEIAREPVTGPAFAGPPAEDPGPPAVRLFEQAASRHADTVAVRDVAGALTYRELDERANRLAHTLLAAGLAKEQPVGVLLEPGCDLVVALLGIHKAGGAYLPFDVTYPAGRIGQMLQVTGARLLVTTGQHREAAAEAVGRAHPDSPAEKHVVLLDQLPADAPTDPVDVRVEPGDLGHIVFTSGSTGVPKAVAVEHRSISAYLVGTRHRFGEDLAGASWAMMSTPAADMGFTAIWCALTTGGTLHLLDREHASDPRAVADYFRRHRIDAVKMVPSHLHQLGSTAEGGLAAVLPHRLLICTGEALPWDLVARIREVRPDLRIQNHYGHTETTLSNLMYEVPPGPVATRTGTVPVGTPLPGAKGWLVDMLGRPVPPGLPGELWLAGPGVARGYVGDDELTAARFVPDPTGGEHRCYRSGDILQVDRHGTVTYHGRADDQVKIRGYRVEPGETAAALRALPDIADAAVLAVGEDPRRTLAAWVVPAPGTTPDPAAWRTALRDRLPDYMIPTSFTLVDRIPLTPTGKLDRAKLPEPTTEPQAYEPPATPTESRIVEVWQEVLDVDRVGATDDFFALGGDSFSAVQAVRMIHPKLRVIDLFTHPVLRDLAAFVDTSVDSAGDGRLLHRLAGPGPEDTTLTLVCVPYGGGSAAAYRPVAEALVAAMPGTAVLAVEMPGHDPARPDEPLLPMDELVDRVVQEIEDTVTGPVALYGHCVGSATAVAIARRLEEQGRDVAGVVVAGSFPTARLPGRIPAFFSRVFGADRWASRRLARDNLRAMGGILDEMDEAATRTMVDAMRHDSREARLWFTTQLSNAEPPARLRAPILCLIGERDPLTDLYQERYLEWAAFSPHVSLAVLPRAGHYFLKYQAEQVAAEIVRAVTAWRQGRLPKAVAPEEVPVTGEQARRDLRSFYLMAAGQMVALLGVTLTSFALAFWAFQRTGSATSFGLIMMLAVLPSALLAPLGGAVADKVDRRLVMMAANGVSALCVATLVLLLVTDSLELWSVSLVVGVSALATAFHQPAYLAAIAQLVPKPYLPQANAIAQMGTSVAQLAAPFAGGLLLELVGVAPVVGINIATFGVGILSLLAIRLPDRMFRRADEPFRTALVGGWRFLVKRRPLMIMIGFFMVVNFFTAVTWVSTAPLIMPMGGADALGFVSSIGWIGAILGGLSIIPWGGTRRRAHGMIGFLIGSGLGMAIMGLQASLPLIALGLAIRLGTMAIVNAHWLAIIQIKVHHELQGRVLAANLMMGMSTQPLGFLLAGPLADHVFEPLMAEDGALAGTVGQVIGVGEGRGMALMVLVSGLFLAIWAALGLLYRPLRLMEDYLPDAVPGPEIDDDLDAIQAEMDQQLVATRNAEAVPAGR